MTIPGASLLRRLPARLPFLLSAALAPLAVGAAPAAALQPNGTFVQVRARRRCTRWSAEH